MQGFLRTATAFLMLVLIVPAYTAFAGEPTGDACYGKDVELKCYNRSTGEWCGSMAGTSCWDEAQELCAAQSFGSPCSAECRMKKECNNAFPECCGRDCALYYKFSKGGWDFSGACPAGFRP